jgi:hypothetical protein
MDNGQLTMVDAAFGRAIRLSFSIAVAINAMHKPIRHNDLFQLILFGSHCRHNPCSEISL